MKYGVSSEQIETGLKLIRAAQDLNAQHYYWVEFESGCWMKDASITWNLECDQHCAIDGLSLDSTSTDKIGTKQ